MREDGVLHCCHNRHHGQAADDPRLKYRKESSDYRCGVYVDTATNYGEPRPSASPRPKQPTTPSVKPAEATKPAGTWAFDWVKETKEPLEGDRLVWVANQFGLPEEVFALADTIWVNDDGHYHFGVGFPEYDGRGELIGFSIRRIERRPDGTYALGEKRSYGKRGLGLVKGWKEKPDNDPIFLPEGASDILTLTTFGMTAISRPSNVGGVDHLVELLRDIPHDRPIMVVGENDDKGNGHWPGRQGAHSVATQLEERLGRNVWVVFPPDGSKDVRAWFNDQINALGAGRDSVVVPDTPFDQLALHFDSTFIKPDPELVHDQARSFPIRSGRE